MRFVFRNTSVPVPAKRSLKLNIPIDLSQGISLAFFVGKTLSWITPGFCKVHARITPCLFHFNRLTSFGESENNNNRCLGLYFRITDWHSIVTEIALHLFRRCSYSSRFIHILYRIQKTFFLTRSSLSF